MRPSMRLLAAAVLAVVIVAAVIAYRAVSGVEDPESASCPHPSITASPERVAADHREVDIRFACEHASQAATIYLPATPGSHPGLVWVHGAGPASRLTWGGPLLPGLVGAGIAVLSYDKRGVGQSEGECCPGDTGHFNLLTADVVGAIGVLRARRDIDPDRVGLAGASQAGWIAPRAANQAHAAFVALASAPAVPERVANLYERLSAGEEGRLSPVRDLPTHARGRTGGVRPAARPASDDHAQPLAVRHRRRLHTGSRKRRGSEGPADRGPRHHDPDLPRSRSRPRRQPTDQPRRHTDDDRMGPAARPLEFLADSGADPVALGAGDLLAAGSGDRGQEFAGQVVDVEFGLVDVDVDQGVPVCVADAQPSARRSG